MIFLGFTCLFLGLVIAIMFLMAMGARGVAEEKRRQEAERRAAENEGEK